MPATRRSRKGIVINGLVILSDRPVPWNAEHTNPPGGLEKYYQDNVIGGPGAFVLVAENFNSFGRAIIKKLIAEIALLAAGASQSSPLRPVAALWRCAGAPRSAIAIARSTHKPLFSNRFQTSRRLE